MMTTSAASTFQARKGRVIRALAEDSKRGVWALADQGVVSLGNFGLSLVLARHFEFHHNEAKYGAFWVLMELMIFLNGLQAALVVYPLTVRGAPLNTDGLGRMASESLLLTLLTGPMLIMGMMVTAYVAHFPLGVGLWAGVALLFWQLQETARRALMAHLRFRSACIGDTLSYLGQFVAVACLSRWDALDLQRTFQAIAATSALGCLLQVIQLRLQRTTRHDLLAFARQCWSLGSWKLYGNLSNLFSGALFNWNFAYWAGLESVGIYYALMNLMRPAHPLAFAVGTLITPNSARAMNDQGIDRARNVALRFTLLGGLLLAPYLALLLFFPRFSLSVLYGSASAYLQYASLVRVCAIAIVFIYLAIAFGSFLSGVERVRQSFFGQLAFTAAYLIIVMPLTAHYGLHGALWGWLVAAALCTAVNAYFTFADPKPSPAIQTDP